MIFSLGLNSFFANSIIPNIKYLPNPIPLYPRAIAMPKCPM